MRAPFRRFLAIAVLASGLGAAHAQDGIVVVDQERLFQESRLGQQIAEAVEVLSAKLAAENRAIEAELIAEERSLTEQRPSLDPKVFRELADAFDSKVDSLRAEQDAKTRELVTRRDAERLEFTRALGPILLEYMRLNGATVMLDRRSVLAVGERVDVTDELIEMVNRSAVPQDSPADPVQPDATMPEASETPATPRP